MMQVSVVCNSAGLSQSQLEQLCGPEQLERTLHLLFYLSHWAKARERLFFVDRQGLYVVKAAVLRQAYAVGTIEATAYIDGTAGFGKDVMLIAFQYISPRSHYMFHLPFRLAETFLSVQHIHKLKNAPAASREFGEYYGRSITESESLRNPIREILWELGVDIGTICPRQLCNKQDYELGLIMRNSPWDEDFYYNDEDEELD